MTTNSTRVKLKVYAVTHEGMTTYFSRKRNAQRFNSYHDEPAKLETHVYDAQRLADLLNGEEAALHQSGYKETLGETVSESFIPAPSAPSVSNSGETQGSMSGIVQFEQRQDFLGNPTDGWYWRDDACEEPMGPFDTLDEARADHRKLRGVLSAHPEKING